MKKILFISVLSLCLLLTACTNVITKPVESDVSSKTESSKIESSKVESSKKEISKVESSKEESKQSQVESETSKITTPAPLESSESSKTEINSRPNEEDNNLYGIAFLGYESVEGAITPPYAYIDDEKFKQMESVMHEGSEYYLIVPSNEDIKVEIFSLDSMGGIVDCIYKSDKAVPVLLRCNLSDIRCNTLVRFSHDDTVIDYSPSLNMMDGSITIEDGGYLLELIETSTDDNTTDLTYENALAKVVGGEYLEGRALMRVEDQEILGNLCAVFKVGTNTEEKFTTEDWLAVSKNGTVYIYDIIADEWSEYESTN